MTRFRRNSEEPQETVEFDARLAHFNGMTMRVQRVSRGHERWIAIGIIDASASNGSPMLRVPLDQVTALLQVLATAAGLKERDGRSAS